MTTNVNESADSMFSYDYSARAEPCVSVGSFLCLLEHAASPTSQCKQRGEQGGQRKRMRDPSRSREIMIASFLTRFCAIYCLVC